MRYFRYFRGPSRVFRELLAWAFDVLGLGLGIASVLVVMVGLLPEDRMREQRSVAIWGPEPDDGARETAHSTQTAFAKRRISASIAGYDRARE